MSVIEFFFLFQINKKNMTNAALFDTTHVEMPYRAAILFYKKNVFLHFKAVIKLCPNFKVMWLYYQL